jgi:hypothetical protein
MTTISSTRTIFCIILIALISLMSGCALEIPLKGAIEPPATISKLPITVGVYYSPEFKDYLYTGSRGGDQWKFPLGAASVKLYDQTFPVLFSNCFPVQTRPPLSAGTPECAAVIEPRIEAFDFSIPFFKTSSYGAEITYRYTLYSPKGDPVASWIVKGSGAKSGKPGFEFARWPGEAADLAMQDAVNKFMTTFSETPEVRAWLKQNNLPVPALKSY